MMDQIDENAPTTILTIQKWCTRRIDIYRGKASSSFKPNGFVSDAFLKVQNLERKGLRIASQLMQELSLRNRRKK
jgi:hypothetical protein